MRAVESVKRVMAACVAAISLHGTAHADALRVTTDRGKVEGRAGTSDASVRAFLGMPYAAPPVGALRWRPPQPAAKWHGVRPALNFGARCMQPQIYKDMIFRDAGASEDCLTLNVWTPAKDKHAKLPVMVWIYGGGFETGGTSEGRQDGEHLATKGVVVVTMNYRLGVFGFFAHRELAAESPQHAAGNYGLMDQAAALGWVKRNIAAFGGDPEKVTIFGESAGSFSVSAQMASPLSRGLFVRAIGESGGAFWSKSLDFPTLAASEAAGEHFAASVLGRSTLAELRSVSGEELLKASQTKGADDATPSFKPNVDGYFLPQSVPAIYAAGNQAKVPLLAGWNKDEGAETADAPEQTTPAGWRRTAQQDFGDRASDFLNAYAAASQDELQRSAEDYSGDRFIAYSTWAWLEAQVKTGGAPVYRYRFDLGSPGDPNHSQSLGAFHSDEIEYVFGNLDSRKGAPWRPEDRKLSEAMQTYWTNFAKTGDPNGGGLPQWPVYDAAGGWPVMHLDALPGAKPDAQRRRYLFLDEVWGK